MKDMNLYIFAFFIFFGCIPAIFSNESGGEDENFYTDEDDSLSLMETVLLFPLSVTGKTRLPEQIEEDNSYLGLVSQLMTVTLDFFEKYDPTNWIEEYVEPTGLAIKDSVSAVTLAVLDFPTCFANLSETCCTLVTVQILPTVRDTVCHLLNTSLSFLQANWDRVLQWPDSNTDALRYAVVTLLALSMIPVFRYKDSKVTTKKSSETKSPKTKRFLECDFGQNISPSFIKYTVQPLSPVLETSRETISPRVRAKEPCVMKPFKSSPLNHYQMCEYFDRMPCNCGGRDVNLAQFYQFDNIKINNKDKACKQKSKKVKRSSTMNPNKHKCTKGSSMQPFKLSPQKHYLMCEYFDQMPCNCGGRDVNLTPFNNFDNININKDEVGIHVGKQKSTKGSSPMKPNKHTKGSPKTVMNNHLPKKRRQYISPRKTVDGSSAASYITNKENIIYDLSEYQRATLELYETEQGDNDLDLSITSEIGDPCFNSSFKEEAVYIIQDAMETCVIGDGPNAHCPTILTKRSPTKQLGLSFEHDDSLSSVDGSFEDYSDVTYAEDDDSLLDSSVLNRSMSYDSGHGVLELAVVIMVQKVYQWTRGFLRQRKLSKHDVSVEILKDKFSTVKSYNNNSTDEECNVSRNGLETDIDHYCYKDQSDSSNFEPFSLSGGDSQSSEPKVNHDTRHRVSSAIDIKRPEHSQSSQLKINEDTRSEVAGSIDRERPEYSQCSELKINQDIRPGVASANDSERPEHEMTENINLVSETNSFPHAITYYDVAFNLSKDTDLKESRDIQAEAKSMATVAELTDCKIESRVDTATIETHVSSTCDTVDVDPTELRALDTELGEHKHQNSKLPKESNNTEVTMEAFEAIPEIVEDTVKNALENGDDTSPGKQL